MKWKHHKPVLTFRWPILHGSPIASPLNAILQSLFIAVWDGLRIHGARRGNVFCYVVLCSQALLLSSFSSPCSLSAFALMCSFYFMPKLMSQNENECYIIIIMCFTRCFANMICNAFLQVFHNMFYCSSVLFNSLELFRICSTVLQSNVFFMSISNVFVLPFFFFGNCLGDGLRDGIPGRQGDHGPSLQVLVEKLEKGPFFWRKEKGKKRKFKKREKSRKSRKGKIQKK